MSPLHTTEAQRKQNQREGLLVCMMLAACMDGNRSPEELQEIAFITSTEPEFQSLTPNEFENILTRAGADLHHKPDQLMADLLTLLDDENSRRRGVELATRVICSNGILDPDEQALLARLVSLLDLPREALADCRALAMRRVAQIMILYLVALTATADGEIDRVEIEEMLPFALTLPVFDGIPNEELAILGSSVRRNVAEMREDGGIAFICETLNKASETLGDPSLPEQAFRLVARGICADGNIHDSERDFAVQVAEKLQLRSENGQRIIETALQEPHVG